MQISEPFLGFVRYLFFSAIRIKELVSTEPPPTTVHQTLIIIEESPTNETLLPNEPSPTNETILLNEQTPTNETLLPEVKSNELEIWSLQIF